MRILVTGGGGFIGGALIKRLVEEGHQVSSLARGDYPWLREIGVDVICADLQDVRSVVQASAGMDIVFHVAAKAGLWGSYREFFDVNVTGTKNVIHACIKNGVRSLVFTSSASVVFDGNNIEGLNENLPYPSRPLSHYTATKALAEQAVLNANGPDLKTISLRPHLVWGPGDRHILPRIINQAKAGKLRIIGNGKNVIDTTYIDNAVLVHLCAAKALIDNLKACGKTYFISNGEPVLLWELVNGLLKAAGLAPPKKKISSGAAMKIAGTLELFHKIFRAGKAPRLTRFLVHELTASHWFDISAAETELGYRPEVTIQEGLKLLAEYNRRV